MYHCLSFVLYVLLLSLCLSKGPSRDTIENELENKCCGRMSMHCQCAVNNNDALGVVEKPFKSTLEQISCEYTNSLFPKFVQKKNKKIEVKREDITSARDKENQVTL